ncbi:unnamed protein product, partial [Mesorhabditis spiculigera]
MLSLETQQKLDDEERNEEEIYENLIFWMRTVHTEEDVDWNVDALATGRTIAEFLNKIDPKFFSKDGFLEKISSFTRADSAFGVKEVSLRKIRMRLTEYYETIIRRNLEPLADLTEISRDFIRGDVGAAVIFLSTAIAAAFLGPHREVYINGLAAVPNNVMKTLAEQIQRIQDRTPALSPPNSPSTSKEVEAEPEPHDDTLEPDEEIKRQAEKIEKLNERVKRLIGDKERLEGEVTGLKERLHDDEAGPRSSALAEQNQELRLKVGVLMDDLTVAELEKGQLKENERQMADKHRKMEERLREMQGEVDNVQQLRDEIQVLKEFERKCEKNESQIHQLKSKLDQREGLMSDNKLLNERLQTYMNAQMDFEDMQKRNQALQQQLAMAKGELDAKEKAHRELTLKIDKLDYELGVVQERKIALEEENRRIRKEKDTLEEDMIRHNASMGSQFDESTNSLHDAMASAMATEGPSDANERVSMLEKMMRLEIENSRLKEKTVSAESAEELKSQTESLKRTIVELTSDLRISNLKNSELQTKLDTLERDQCDQGALNGSDRERRVAAEKMDIEMAKLRDRAVKAEAALTSFTEKGGQESDVLTKRAVEAEAQAWKEP